MTTFQDIFKSSFLENVTSVSLLDMTLALILALAWACLFSWSTRRPSPASCTLPALA